jgi:hypothetical protein
VRACVRLRALAGVRTALDHGPTVTAKGDPETYSAKDRRLVGISSYVTPSPESCHGGRGQLEGSSRSTAIGS